MTDEQGRINAVKMATPSHWPAWPVLPVKHRTKKDAHGMALLGVVIDPAEFPAGGPGFRIYHCLMYDVPKTVEGIKALPQSVYLTAGEAVIDGWVVD